MSLPSTLSDVLVRIESGKSFKTTEAIARDDQLGVLKVSAVTWSAFDPAEAKAVDEDYEPEDHHRVRRHDLLISRANTKELVGAVVRVDRDYPYRLLSDKTLRLVVDINKVDPDYLMFSLRSQAARKHIEHFATGTSDSMRNISQDIIAAIPLLLPRIEVQQNLAARLKAQLGLVDAARVAAETQLAEIRALPQRLLAAAFDTQLD